MDQFHLIRYVIVGSFHRDFIITSDGATYFDIPGGSLPYCATGFGLWDTGLGMVGSIGEDFPHDWLASFEQFGFDTRGISILPDNYDLRSFIFYIDNERYESLNPITQFSHLKLAIPKSLLGYIPEKQRFPYYSMDEKIPIQIQKIPSDYLDASALHICPLNLTEQMKLISYFQDHVNTISLDLPEAQTQSTSQRDITRLLKNIQILQVSEKKIQSIYKGRTENTWEMIDDLMDYGLEMIIIKRGEEGQYIYDGFSKKRWSIPAYPAKQIDTTGCGDAFCGGFIAGYRKTYDPVEAALYGNISASFSIEGTGPLYPMDMLPGLSMARIEKLRAMVKRI